MEKERVCPNCNKENVKDANFCEYCGTKISETCPVCWKKEGQPYNCGCDRCPGHRLPLRDKINQAK